MAKFRHFGNMLKLFGNCVRVLLVVGKIEDSLWKSFYAIGNFFTVVNGQILET